MKKLLNWIGEAVDKLLLGYMTKTGLVLWDSGGGSAPAQPTSTQQTTSNIPDWAIPYATQNLGKAQSLTDVNQNPYQQYQGQRVADFTPLQQQAMTNIGGMQTNQATQAGIDTAANAAQQAGQYQTYNPQQFGNQYQGQNFQSMGLGALGVGSQNFGAQSAQDYMSPYAQQAIDPTLRENQRQFDVATTGRQAAATRSGAFGGSRQAIEQSEAQRNLSQLQSNTQAQGMQNAFQNAQQQFNADQARRMQAQQLNQAAQLQAQGQGLQQNLAANQQGMQNAQLMAQYGLAGQQAGEQSRQFGANLGLQGLQQQLAAAGMMGNLGQNQYTQAMGINAAQQQAGAQQQAQTQQGLSNQYQDFLNQQNYPYKQIGFMSDVLRGTPTSGGATSMYQAPAPLSTSLLGLGQAGLGGLMYGMGKG